MKQQPAIEVQADETKHALALVQNYANSLAETNDDLRIVLKAAITEKHNAFRLTNKAKRLAADRLDKWHQERTMQSTADDKLARQLKSGKQLELILEEYRSQLQVSIKTKHQLSKEWGDKEAAAPHGGARRWPPWVVQIICEMLVNGISHLAVPPAMQIMNQMLTGGMPKGLPSGSLLVIAEL